MAVTETLHFWTVSQAQSCLLRFLPFQCFWKFSERAVHVEIKDEFLENNLGYNKLTGPRFFLFVKIRWNFVI